MSLLTRLRDRVHPRGTRRPYAAAGSVELAAAPDTVEVGPHRLRLGPGVCASFAVTGYPHEVGYGWLEPLLTYPGRLDVSLHVEPIPPQVAADRLRRQRARLQAGAHHDAERGRLADPEAEAAADDAADLASRLARGQDKLFRVGLYLTVHARDETELDAECSHVRALASSLLLDARPASFRSLQGWTTTLPLGCDALALRRTFDTSALAAAFPFASPDLPHQAGSANGEGGEGGVLYGLSTASSGVVVWDRFACDNHNAVILARSGAGKSYLAKLETLRHLYHGVEAAIIDPEDEYRRLTEAVGGTHLRLGAPGVRINPFDLPPGARAQDDAVTRRALFIHSLVAVALGRDLDPAQRAALDRATVAAYTAAGITTDARTWVRPAPQLGQLTDALQADSDPRAPELAEQLAPYVTGSYAGLFDGPTTTRPEGHLLTISLRDLPDELKTVGTLLALDAVWRRVSDPREPRRRLVLVDEAWLLMRDSHGARFLQQMAKAARKHWAGLTVVTQDAADLLGSQLGQAVAANAATQILLRQAPQAIDRVAEAFGLTAGERERLLAAERGEGLLAAGASRVSFRAVASQAEHRLVTSDPAELAALDDTTGEEESLS